MKLVNYVVEIDFKIVISFLEKFGKKCKILYLFDIIKV